MQPRTFKQKLYAALRVQLYVAVVCGVLTYVSFVRAYNRAEHVLGELGIGLLSGLGGLRAGVEEVELNGQRFTFGAAASPQDPDALVTQFESECGEASGSLADDLTPLLEEAKKKGHKLPERDASLLSTMVERADDGSAAHSACFVRPEDKQSGSIWQRVKKLADTGKLGALGAFRYLRASKVRGSNLTRVLAISSNGDLDIDAMMPDEGDARGSDPRVASRPPEATRVFSARVVGSGQGAYMYDSKLDTTTLLKHYDDTLGKKQLAPVEMLDENGKVVADTRVYAAQDGAVAVYVVEGDDGKRTLTVLEFGHFELAEGH
jgi:hypothetical protein